MSADDASPSEEFLFGRLSTPAGRVEEARQERKGFFDLSVLEPLDPRPGEPIRLRFRCGVDVSLERLRVFWTRDGTTPAWKERLEEQNSTNSADAQPLAPVWDTLSWGYVQDWEAELPAQPEGTLLRYAAVGLDPSGTTIPCPWPDRDRHGTPHLAAVAVDRLEPPEWLRRAVIYQVLVDRFAPTPGEPFVAAGDLDGRLGGTLWGLIERLDDLSALGVDTLWLTPIFASPNYHGYAVSDFFRVEPALGGEAAWQELVIACRRRGLRLVLDFVANHVSDQHAAFVAAIASADSPTHSWFRFHNGPQEYDCFFDQPQQPELDAEQTAVREHLLQAATHWLREGCDGFRLDYAHGLSHGFWSQFRSATRTAVAESVCFGEITHTPQIVRSYAGRLDGCLDFALCELLRETFARGGLPLSEFARCLQQHFAYFQDRLVLPSFLDNHDMNRFIVAADGDPRRLKLAALVQFLLPGPPIIYYGTEVGLSQNRPLGRLEESRLPMPPLEQWDQELRDFYRALIQFRRDAAPCGSLPELLWVDDESRSAAWRIGSLQLVVNCGEARVFSMGSAVPRFTTFTSDSGPPLAGSLSLPAWSAAVLSHTCEPPTHR
jgi:glycosidase